MAERILIVDDEPAIADTLAYVLKNEGYSTRCVGLGGDALHWLQVQNDEQFSLVILDVGLPDISGFDVCRSVRKTSEIPVIFLTARSEELDRIIGLEIGADDYVSKPFSPREVASRVRAILRRTQNKATAQATATSASEHCTDAAGQQQAAFQHDTEGLRIAYHGHWLSLTRYEYLLLAALLARPGRVYSRAYLMETVWNDAEESLERTVDAHIKTLRAKLREINQNDPPIETHRGMGYSIRA